MHTRNCLQLVCACALMFARVPRLRNRFTRQLCSLASAVGCFQLSHVLRCNGLILQLLSLSRHKSMLGGSLSPQHGASSGCGWRNSLQLWRAAANILNKQPRTNDKGWSSSPWLQKINLLQIYSCRLSMFYLRITWGWPPIGAETCSK
jgi:hypothetical protein